MRTRKLHSNWFEAGMTASEKAAITELVMGSEPVFKVLAQILRKELQVLERKYNYDSPAWQYELALDNGQKKKLNDLLTLLTPVIGEE